MPPAPPQSPLDDGAARHLEVGVAMPDVVLASTQGGTVDLRTRGGTSVVYIYPWTGRPGLADPPGWDGIVGAHGSTPETAGFGNLHREFATLRVAVFGLSTQSTEHQRELVERLGVPFALLSDAAFEVQGGLGLPTFTAGGVRYLTRLTLVVQDGRIARVFYPVHPPETHAREVLDWLKGR